MKKLNLILLLCAVSGISFGQLKVIQNGNVGIGGNGHIGFNEPGVAFEKETHCVKTVNENFKAELEDRTNKRGYLKEKITSEKILTRMLEVIDEV
jgi:6-phosphogluconolactonase/glucosamine-6-phosphate isomerase/deaminase